MPGEGNGGGEGGKTGAEGAQELAKLNETLGTIKSELATAEGAKKDLEQKLEDADKELLSDDYLSYKEKQGKGGKKEGEEGGEGKGELNLDEASNRDIVKHIEGKYKGAVDSAVTEMAGRLDKTNERIGLAFAQIDVTLTAMRHSDFNEHSEDIFKIAKDNPSWGAEKCYKQFKLEAKQTTDEKAIADKKKADEEHKALTEKTGAPAGATQEKDLSAADAAEAGYKAAFGSKDTE